jgi:hypothetical protein
MQLKKASGNEVYWDGGVGASWKDPSPLVAQELLRPESVMETGEQVLVVGRVSEGLSRLRVLLSEALPPLRHHTHARTPLVTFRVSCTKSGLC